jgi:hypothetical protein
VRLVHDAKANTIAGSVHGADPSMKGSPLPVFSCPDRTKLEGRADPAKGHGVCKLANPDAVPEANAAAVTLSRVMPSWPSAFPRQTTTNPGAG